MNRGFTLIEILAVISVFICLAGFSFTALRALMPSLRISSAVRELVSDLRLAQSLALSEQVNYGVILNTVDNSYQFVCYGTSTFYFGQKQLGQGMVFGQVSGLTGDEAVFNPYGAAKEQGEIIITNAAGDSKTIDIRPSGFVKIK